MGRMLDALRRADNVPSESEQPRGNVPALTPIADEEPMLVAPDEIPFIEVGPRKSMEASPSVLACSPPPSPPHLSLAPPPEEHDEPLPKMASPRGVQFRALPTRNASHSSFAAELVAYHAPEQVAARQFRDVLDAVFNASATPNRGAVLLLTSILPGCGTTTALLNLAITAARQSRQRVVVVDAHFRRPAVADKLGLPAAPGLREVMAGTIALDEAIQTTEQENLLALTAGIRESGGVRFVAESLRSLLRQLRQRYPLVFVDGPRWDSKQDVLTLAAACDSVLLVVPESEADTPQTDALLRLIPQQGARLAGCILVAETSPPR
jgi:Mrp family chromosome partitioning ATPase